MLVLTIAVSVLAVAVIILAGSNIKHSQRFNTHRDLIENNLNITQSLDRSLDAIKYAYQGFVVSELEAHTTKTRVDYNKTQIAIEAGTIITDWDLRKHKVADVLLYLLDHLELDWQLQKEKIIFSKREDKKKKS